jgi:hypothetical protein
VQFAGHLEAAEPDDQLHSWDVLVAAEPDDQLSSWDDQAADQQDDQEQLHQVRHRQPVGAVYLDAVSQVVERRDEESRESHRGQVRAERFDLRQLNQTERQVLREQLARQEQQRQQPVLQGQLVRQEPQRQQLGLQPLMFER